MQAAGNGDARRASRIVVCGGGVGAVESLLALHALGGLDAEVSLVAPEREFVFEPLSVAAPFGRARTHIFDLQELAALCGAELSLDRLAAVDPELGEVVLESGARLPYDRLIVAVGGRRRAWLQGALHFGGDADVAAYTELLETLVRGTSKRLAFVGPPGPSWSLPLFELALLTSAHLADAGVAGIELTLVTPEAEPLEDFGPAAAHALRDLLADRGIALRTGAQARAFDQGHLRCDPGPELEADHVVTLAQLAGPSLPGLPADEDGFIELAHNSRVVGLDGVYAAGDGASSPVKQGGVTAWQADVAVADIARSLGVQAPEHPDRPALRAMMLTGIAPTYLRAQIDDAEHTRVAGSPLWWPPAKVAGRYLAPWIAGDERQAFEDRESEGGEISLSDLHAEARQLALTFADSDAMHGDHASALHWLEVVEHLEGELPPPYERRRAEWAALAAAPRAHAG